MVSMLLANKRKFYFANYVEEAPIYDKEGNRTGEYTVTYTDKTVCFANILTSSSKISMDYFGADIDCTYIMLLPKGVKFDENTVFWIDNLDNENPDYKVTEMSETIKYKFIALSRI